MKGSILECDSTQVRPGAAISALLLSDDKRGAVRGVTVPESARRAVHRQGMDVRCNTSTNSFTRTEVSLQIPAEGGWFQSSSPNAVKVGDRVVIQGAQELLSEEQKAQISID